MPQIYDTALLGQGVVSGVAMTDARWETRMEAINYMAIEWGVADNPGGMIMLIKEYWDLLDNDLLVDGYIAGQRYMMLAAKKVEQGGELLAVEQAEADAIAAALGLPPI